MTAGTAFSKYIDNSLIRIIIPNQDTGACRLGAYSPDPIIRTTHLPSGEIHR